MSEAGFEPGVLSPQTRALPAAHFPTAWLGRLAEPLHPSTQGPQAQSHLAALEGARVGARAGARASGQDVPSRRD